MGRVHMRMLVRGGEAKGTFAKICNFESYPQLTDAVQRVTLTVSEGGHAVSDWEVLFRNGRLRWSEEDDFDPERLTIRFRQLEGDFESFGGIWSVDEDRAGCAVSLQAEFDLGMPTLAEMLDPVAESALRENVVRIVEGVVGSPIEVFP